MDLVSQRLIFRKLTDVDAAFYIPMAMNEEVMKFITGRPLTLPEACERFDNMLDTNKRNKDAGFYCVHEKSNADYIGLGKMVYINNNTAEIGYSLLPQYWGNRYASEMAGCFIKHAQRHPSVKSLIAVVNPENIASKRLLEKNGFGWIDTGFVNSLAVEIHQLDLMANQL